MSASMDFQIGSTCLIQKKQVIPCHYDILCVKVSAITKNYYQFENIDAQVYFWMSKKEFEKDYSILEHPITSEMLDKEEASTASNGDLREDILSIQETLGKILELMTIDFSKRHNNPPINQEASNNGK